MAGDSSPDYKALFLRAEELRKQAEDRGRQERERNRQTTFREFIRACHNLLSRPLRVAAPYLSTQGTIPPPTGKFCPTRLVPWSDLPTRQQAIYSSVCGYLQPSDAPQLFPSLIELEGIGRRFNRRSLSSEKDLESYERFAVEDHVHDIISELCNIPGAQDEFRLGNGVRFDNHANALDEQPPDAQRSRPDQFCIHRIDGDISTLLTTVEYKPPHKLSVENLRVGLRPMNNFWEHVVNSETIPTDQEEKLTYNAERLAGSAIVQEYHVMIQEGLAYSYLTTGLAQVLLHVPYGDPSTLYYYLCEPNMDVNIEDQGFDQPKTAIARVLCLCLMSFHSHPRAQGWRNAAQAQLHTWTTSFDYTHSHIPKEELLQNPPDSEYTSSEPSGSEYLPSSSPVESPAAKSHRRTAQSQTNCSPSNAMDRAGSIDSSESDSNQGATGRKRDFSQITSSPPTQRSARQTNTRRGQGGQYRHAAQYCTQQCLLGLQQSGRLDEHCPNVELHRQGQDGNRHLISSNVLVQLLKQQLDKTLDYNCTPLGICGASGAPFKITCAVYGYTVIGKGTTSFLWKEVSREAEIYQILRKAQGSAVPVFLGAINLAKIYFLHGAGEIRHMLLMAWGGESITKFEQTPELRREVSRSRREIRSLGVKHQDLRSDNILWNPELQRVLIIDFHLSELDRRPKEKRLLKRSLSRTDTQEPKRLRVESE